MMNLPDKEQTDRQDENSARREENLKDHEKNGIKHGEWKQRMIHDEPQDEQMHDEFGKDGEPVPPGE